MNKPQWSYFSNREIEGLETELVAKADIARGKAEIPFVITSGLRTPEQNFHSGGVSDSAHLTGQAIDLQLRNSHELFKMIEGLLYAGINRIVIGIKTNPVTGELVYHNLHFDIDKSKPQGIISVKEYQWH